MVGTDEEEEEEEEVKSPELKCLLLRPLAGNSVQI